MEIFFFEPKPEYEIARPKELKTTRSFAARELKYTIFIELACIDGTFLTTLVEIYYGHSFGQISTSAIGYSHSSVSSIGM